MRLLLACIVLFLAPAGALLVTDQRVSGIEEEFLKDAQKQTERLNSIYQLYPPRVRRMALATAILQLRGLDDGAAVASRVCGAPDSPFRRLFDDLGERCGTWSLLRRSRWSALLAVVATAFVFGLILMARITVQRYASLEMSPGSWTMWFVMRGVTLLLAAQVAVSLSGYGIILQTMTGKLATTLAALTVPFLLLVWLERRVVLAFVEPKRLNVFRTRGVPTADAAMAAAAPVATAAKPATPRAAAAAPPVRDGIGVARRRRAM